MNLPTIRNIAYISNMKGNKTSLLFAMNGITEDAAREIKRLSVNHLYVLCIEKKDLMELESTEACEQLILDKWRKQTGIEYYFSVDKPQTNAFVAFCFWMARQEVAFLEECRESKGCESLREDFYTKFKPEN